MHSVPIMKKVSRVRVGPVAFVFVRSLAAIGPPEGNEYSLSFLFRYKKLISVSFLA